MHVGGWRLEGVGRCARMAVQPLLSLSSGTAFSDMLSRNGFERDDAVRMQRALGHGSTVQVLSFDEDRGASGLTHIESIKGVDVIRSGLAS